MAPSTAALNALGHAVSGSAGTAVSTATLYPLDLVNTRLKAQGQLKDRPADGSAQHQYHGVVDAFRSIVASEGGISALYSGLGPSVAKSIVDSFLFFGFYNYLQGAARSRRRGKAPGALEELLVGATAGAMARAVTTPVSNAVARKQTAQGDDGGAASLRDVLAAIRREMGFLGLWAGYSATLVLTLNPSITFLVSGRLAARIIPALEGEDVPVAWVEFLLAAFSKSMATAVTYPFQTGKTRLQVGSKETSVEEGKGEEKHAKGRDEETRQTKSRVLGLLDKSIFGVILRIVRTEGPGALYDGLQGELLKSFFSHGLTMLTKGVFHRLVIRLWYLMLPYLSRRKLAVRPK